MDWSQILIFMLRPLKYLDLTCSLSWYRLRRDPWAHEVNLWVQSTQVIMDRACRVSIAILALGIDSYWGSWTLRASGASEGGFTGHVAAGLSVSVQYLSAGPLTFGDAVSEIVSRRLQSTQAEWVYLNPLRWQNDVAA